MLRGRLRSACSSAISLLLLSAVASVSETFSTPTAGLTKNFTLFVMVPEATPVGAAVTTSTLPSDQSQDDPVLAGYRECATEAMLWLSGLGYESGHPLMRSLAAHLTKRQAYLEKIDLECFLVDKSLRNEDDEELDEDEDGDGNDSLFVGRLKELRNDRSLQRFLLEAVFRGCDLRYQ